jgi:hypothetical protein
VADYIGSSELGKMLTAIVEQESFGLRWFGGLSGNQALLFHWGSAFQAAKEIQVE